MKIKSPTYSDLVTPNGPMRTHCFSPAGDGPYPAVILYSEIYQMTGPIARTAATIAGKGYIVAVPEVYHEYEPLGTVLTYDKVGTDRGNELKTTKSIDAYDEDARILIEHLLTEPTCTGRVGAMGICLGGHLAFRAAMHPAILAGVCLYPTDIHKRSLGAGMNDNSLDRMSEIKAKMLMVWGRQDPHIDGSGRRKIYDTMTAAGIEFTWHEFNGEHAFLRDEGHRYDPSLAQLVHVLIDDHLSNNLKR